MVRTRRRWRASSVHPRRTRRVEPLYYLKNLPWFAWPALPLALWTLWIRGRGFNGGLGPPGVAAAV